MGVRATDGSLSPFFIGAEPDGRHTYYSIAPFQDDQHVPSRWYTRPFDNGTYM